MRDIYLMKPTAVTFGLKKKKNKKKRRRKGRKVKMDGRFEVYIVKKKLMY